VLNTFESYLGVETFHRAFAQTTSRRASYGNATSTDSLAIARPPSRTSGPLFVHFPLASRLAGDHRDPRV